MQVGKKLARAAGAEEQPVGGLLDRAGDQLRHTLSLINRVQDALPRLIEAAPKSAVADLMELQCLDRAMQEVGDVAAFLAALASATPANWSLDTRHALHSLRLQELAHRFGAKGNDYETLTVDDLEKVTLF